MNGNIKEGYVEIDGIRLRLTNLDKVLWPKEGYTKRDLIYYYFKVADYVLPHLKNRPLTLKRYPNGITGEHFFQKNAAPDTPGWIETKSIYSETTSEYINYIICNNRATLIYLANLAVISQNPWLSRWPTLEHPDFMGFDMDPAPPATFRQAAEAALLVKEQLDALGMKSWVKTSGATGVHIFVPLKPVYSYKQVRTFAQAVSMAVSKLYPELTTVEHSVEKRRGRVYLDYLQNIESKTLASVYSVRAREAAPVSTPLEWSELASVGSPAEFNIFNIFDRLEEKGDLFKGVLETPQELFTSEV